MTKELVKSENGHKIIKRERCRSDTTLPTPTLRIKMTFGRGTLCLVIVLLTVVSSEQLREQQPSLQEDPAKTTESGQSTLAPSTEDGFAVTGNGIANESKDGNFDTTLDDMLIFESLIGEDKVTEENAKPIKENDEKSDDTQSNSEIPDESKVSSDLVEIRRQGDQIPVSKTENSATSAQFDDSKQVVDDSQPRYGQRKSKQRIQDGVPLLQLTEGGYTRPFKRPGFRNRYTSRQDSSEQSPRVQEADGSSNINRNRETGQVIPQVTYAPSLQVPQPPSGLRQTSNPGFEGPNRNILPVQHVVPTTIPSRFFNTPAVFPDYSATPFQAQFPPNNDVGLFSNFIRDPNNAALYQASQSNPFQTPQLLFQNNPEGQTQSYVIEPPRNFQPQFQQNNLNAPRGFINGEDNAGPGYPSYLSNPTQFQIPPNFYSTPPNGLNAFNSPPIRFLPNYPNTENALSPRFFRYPVATDAQNNQQNAKDQNLDSEASQEENNSKAQRQDTVYPRNRDDATAVRFGTRLQAQNDDVYMRYPTNEAGYATPENLPPQNNSEEAKDNGQQTSSEQRNIQSADSPRSGLNSARTNQRINNSFGFPPDLFGDVPLDFGYQRPQNQILDRNRDRNQESPNFESRNFFNPLESLPGSNYPFLNLDDQRRVHREPDGTPSCAKQTNASYCFEDREYPKNEILYSLNSNAFLADRLIGPEVAWNSLTLVERNSTEPEQESENYACSADIKYGSLLRGKNLAGAWKVIVNVEGKLSQPVRMEVCKSLGDPCNIDSNIKTTCVQKYSIQRLLAWIPGIGIHSDAFKIPAACSCQILEPART